MRDDMPQPRRVYDKFNPALHTYNPIAYSFGQWCNKVVSSTLGTMIGVYVLHLVGVL